MKSDFTPPGHTEAVLTHVLELTGTLEYEHDGWSTIVSADWDASDLILLLRVRIPGAPDRQFRIVCQQPRSHRIIALTDDPLVSLTTDHVVLWPHNQKQGDLYFNGTPSDPLSLLGALVESQRDAVGDWFALDCFLHLPGCSADILRAGNGLLAKGPVTLLNTFAHVLDNYGVEHSSIAPRDPVWWNGDCWTRETEQLHALVVGGSYVVAPSFTEKLLS